MHIITGCTDQAAQETFNWEQEQSHINNSPTLSVKTLCQPPYPIVHCSPIIPTPNYNFCKKLILRYIETILSQIDISQSS